MKDFSAWTGKSRLALLIGIDQYPGEKLHALKGCVNDIDSLEGILVRHFEFAVVCLRDAEATRAAILDAMQALLEATAADCQVVLGWSGHGSTLNVPAGGVFETLVPCDSSRDGVWENNRDLTDRELFGWVWQVSEKTRFLTLIIDACQSGSIVRDFQARARGAAGDHGGSGAIARDKGAFAARAAGARAAGSGWLPVSDRYTLLAGCLSTERCREFEDRSTGLTRGLFSYHLHRALARRQGKLTWRDLFAEVATAVTGDNARQHPQLEGNLDLAIFGQETFKPSLFLAVLARQDRRLTLDGGAVHGVQLGSRWSLEPSGSRAAGAGALGEIEIVQVAATRCEALLVGDPRPGLGSEGIRAFEKSRPVDCRFRVLLHPSAAADRELSALLEKSPYLDLRPGKDGAAGDLVIYRLPARNAFWAADPLPHIPKRDTAAWAFVDPQTGVQLAPPVAAAGKESRREAVERAERLARHRFLARLGHPGERPAAHDSVQIHAYRVVESPGSDKIEAVELGDDAVLAPGDRIAFRLIHQNALPLQVTLLSLGLTGGIDMVFPVRGRYEPFAANKILEIGFQEADALEIGLPEDYPIAGEKVEAVVEDHLLFLFTEAMTRGLDLLAQESLRSRRDIPCATPCDLAHRFLQGESLRQGDQVDELANQESWGLLHRKLRLKI